MFTIILNTEVYNNYYYQYLLGEQPDQPLVFNITERKEQSKSVISIMVHFIYSFMLMLLEKPTKFDNGKCSTITTRSKRGVRGIYTCIMTIIYACSFYYY